MEGHHMTMQMRKKSPRARSKVFTPPPMPTSWDPGDLRAWAPESPAPKAAEWLLDDTPIPHEMRLPKARAGRNNPFPEVALIWLEG